MKINKKFILFLVVGVVVFTVLAVGCAPNRRPDETPNDTTPNDTTPKDTTPDDTTPNDTTPNDDTEDKMKDTTPGGTTTDDTTNDEARSDEAKKIADKVEDIDEIDSATCVISDDTAIVGVQFDKEYKGELTDEVKKKVEDVAKKAEDNIDRVAVTADPDLFDRLTTLVDDIGKGKPLTGLRDEIDEILNRIQPK